MTKPVFAIVRREPSEAAERRAVEMIAEALEVGAITRPAAVYRCMLAASEPLTDDEIDGLCIAWDGCLGGQNYHWQRDGRGRWAVPPLDEDSTEWPRRRDFDRARMRAFLAALTGQRP